MNEDDVEPTRFDSTPWHLRVVLRPSRPPSEDDTATLVVPRKRWRKIPTAPEPQPAELLETLSLPPELDESMLRLGAPPRNEPQVRVDIIRVVRALGREYGARGQVLRADAAALLPVQEYLCECRNAALAGRLDPRALEPEIVRHGALLGEILARTLGATWSNLTARKPASWQMNLPPSQQVSPVARVHQFVLHGPGEPDLGDFFRQLSTACVRASHVTLV